LASLEPLARSEAGGDVARVGVDRVMLGQRLWDNQCLGHVPTIVRDMGRDSSQHPFGVAVLSRCPMAVWELDHG
jgi:hypothetical protein